MRIKAQVIKYRYIILILLIAVTFLRSALLHRVATSDETIYLRDTLIIYEALKVKENPFQHNVGLHGVFFKIPVALAYFVTGPSILVATFSNILLGTVSLFLLYAIVKKHLFPDPWALFPAALLAFSYRFYGAGTTFLREMPVLFSFLLFLYFLLEKKSKFLIGLLLLLILDAKEHVFFTIAPPYILILLVENLRKKEKKIPERVVNFIHESFLSIAPSFVYIVLMFTTNIIPVNMFVASILGLVNKNLRFLTASFSVERGSANLIDTNTHTMPQIQRVDGPAFTLLKNILNLFIAYLGKALYPRSFSFTSIPKIILIPAIAMSLKKFKESWKNPRLKTHLFLIILLWFYLIIYVLRASHGRYLFVISPLLFIYFVLFLKEGTRKRKFGLITLGIAGAFVIGGICFEESFVLIKVVINAVLFLILLFLTSKKNAAKNNAQKTSTVLVSLICIFTLGTSIMSSLTIGQLYKYKTWGENLEVEKIMNKFNQKEKIWVGTIVWIGGGWNQLPLYFRNDIGYISESRYELKEWLPAKHLMKKPELYTHSFNWDTINVFKDTVYREGITKVVLITSTTPKDFNMENKLETLLTTGWLTLKEQEQMKNKEIYIFEVRPKQPTTANAKTN